MSGVVVEVVEVVRLNLDGLGGEKLGGGVIYRILKSAFWALLMICYVFKGYFGLKEEKGRRGGA